METLKINGVESQFPDGIPQTLAELLEDLNISASTVVAEIDGEIIKSQDFQHKLLSTGQCIELIRFVGGG